MTIARVVLPVGWLVASIGYYGPWISHGTAALTLNGSDMGEFVKFLPEVLDGTMKVTRQFFYLPPLAVVVSIALLVGSARLHYSRVVRLTALLLAVPLSLQLLPPAWSVASLMSPEFRLQAIALGVAWLLLAGFWLWASLPLWIAGAASVTASMAALGLAAWQFALAKPAIDQVYGTPPPVGWGFFLCMAGLALLAMGSVLVALPAARRPRGGEAWANQ